MCTKVLVRSPICNMHWVSYTAVLCQVFKVACLTCWLFSFIFSLVFSNWNSQNLQWIYCRKETKHENPPLSIYLWTAIFIIEQRAVCWKMVHSEPLNSCCGLIRWIMKKHFWSDRISCKCKNAHFRFKVNLLEA